MNKNLSEIIEDIRCIANKVSCSSYLEKRFFKKESASLLLAVQKNGKYEDSFDCNFHLYNQAYENLIEFRKNKFAKRLWRAL